MTCASGIPLGPARTSEWSTPQTLFAELEREFRFTLDVAASHDNARCEAYFTAEDDGLRQSWAGHTVWMNPPYGPELGAWIERAAGEAAHGSATVVALVPARTDTRWWHRFVWDSRRNQPRPSVQVRFLEGRLRFGGGSGQAPFPSCIIVFARIDSRHADGPPPPFSPLPCGKARPWTLGAAESQSGPNHLTGVRFALRVPDLGEVPVRLTAASETISGILLTNQPWSQRSRSTREEHARLIEAQAHRIAWRQLRDFVEQALLAVETGLFPIGSAFMAHMEVWDEQREETVTMAELVASRAHLGAAERGILLLPRGKARP